MLEKAGLYYRTIKHLNPIQIRYRLWYILRGKLRQLTGHSYPLSTPKEGNKLNLESGLAKPSTINLQPSTNQICFTFLNQTHTFEGAINWDFSKYGKLWTYNLNYFDYLHQPDLTKEEGLNLLRKFIKQIGVNEVGLEPYPTTLRGMNWITFLSKHRLQDKTIDASLYTQYQLLQDNLEYHVLGNHILENGLSLLLGAYYFKDDILWQKAKEIIYAELDEQLLEDGGHYERSVMYHCIILERLLDSYNLLKHNKGFAKQDKLQVKIRKAVSSMISWLDQMVWEDGGLPAVNDHVPEMIPSLPGIWDYADRLTIPTEKIKLGESGYRKYRGAHYELLVDAGDIGPDYVLGHAHSDIFSFLLKINGQEIITDTGTSTYENNQRRQSERSTSAHNTVMVEGEEQNEVWSAFRVGRRGHVRIISEGENRLTAQHDGYQFMGVIHERQYEIKEREIIIRDTLKSDKEGETTGAFYLHFNPHTEIDQMQNVIEGKGFRISFAGHSSIVLEDYKKATGYNSLEDAIQARITFQDDLTTRIRII